MKLDATVVKELQGPIYKVWNYIGYDATELCEGDNECAIEMCLDAGRLLEHGSEKADALAKELYSEHSYVKVLKFLSKNIHLV